jgi:hypothetical protein
MWYHHVAQVPCPEHKWVVAVNMWHDMRFDLRFAYFRLLEGLCRGEGLLPPETEEEQEEEEEEAREAAGGEGARLGEGEGEGEEGSGVSSG